MSRSERGRLSTRRGLIAVAILIGGSLAILRWFDRNPVTLGGWPTEHQVAGSLPASIPRSDIAVWIDSTAIADSAAARRFSTLDFSAAWPLLLEAEFGTVALIDGVASSASESLPSPPRALIVTSSLAGKLTFDAIAPLLEAGTTVLIDADNEARVGESWLSAARLRPAAAQLPPQTPRLTGLLAPHLAAEFAALTFAAPPACSALVADDAATRPLGGDPPIAYERTFGRGKLIVATAPLAKWWCRLSQGEPRDDFSIVERLGDYEGIVEPDDLALDPAQRECEVPFTDRLAHALCDLLDSELPLPRLAWFPIGSRGVFLMTHDEDLRGGAAMVALARRDRELGVHGSHFVIGHPRVLEDWRVWDRQEIQRLGGELAVHWNQMPTPQGLLKIEPVQWVTPLWRQQESLSKLMLGCSNWNRNHFLIVRGSWTETFRILAGGGVLYDSTFAANKGRGYLFGSALPRRVLDENGLPLGVREVAFHNQEDWGGADEGFFDRLFTRNADDGRGVLVSIFHPSAVLRTPTPEALIAHVARSALATGHVAWNVTEFGRYWGSRAAVQFTSRVLDSRTLEIEYRDAAPFEEFEFPVNPFTAPPPPPSTTPSQSILIPVTERGAAVEGAAVFSRETVGGETFLRVDLAPGAGTFTVRFE